MKLPRRAFLGGTAAALAAGCSRIALPPSAAQAPATSAARHLERRLVWSDEFDYHGLPDPAKWAYDVGAGGWGNDELEYYTGARPANARVAGGVLEITARHERYKGAAYTSARLYSKASFTYGRIEVRAKLPGGRGTWPAIWMYPQRSVYGADPRSGEIDIMENVGYSPPWAYPTFHTQHYDALGKPVSGAMRIASIDSAFHVYAAEWTPTGLDVYYDGAHVLGYHPTAAQLRDWRFWPYNEAFFLILNVAVGGSWGGLHGVDAAAFPRTMQIDYVRVYAPLVP